MRHFYWLRVNNSNHIHTELSLDYLKDTKFYLESKASFIHIGGAFISLSSLVRGKSPRFCPRTRSCPRANDAKIVPRRDAQCNTKELP